MANIGGGRNHTGTGNGSQTSTSLMKNQRRILLGRKDARKITFSTFLASMESDEDLLVRHERRNGGVVLALQTQCSEETAT